MARLSVSAWHQHRSGASLHANDALRAFGRVWSAALAEFRRLISTRVTLVTIHSSSEGSSSISMAGCGWEERDEVLPESWRRLRQDEAGCSGVEAAGRKSATKSPPPPTRGRLLAGTGCGSKKRDEVAPPPPTRGRLLGARGRALMRTNAGSCSCPSIARVVWLKLGQMVSCRKRRFSSEIRSAYQRSTTLPVVLVLCR